MADLLTAIPADERTSCVRNVERKETESVMVGRMTEDSVFQVRLNEWFAAADRRLTNAAIAKGLLARRMPDLDAVPLPVAYRGPHEPLR